MPIPEVNYCLVCEGVRPELHNKANILGFFGIIPSVVITVTELGKNIPILLFLVGIEGPSDEIKMKAEVLNPDGSLLKASDEVPFPQLKTNERGLSGFAFAPIMFSKAGKYSFRALINGQLAYEGSFLVQQGIPSLQSLSKQ